MAGVPGEHAAFGGVRDGSQGVPRNVQHTKGDPRGAELHAVFEEFRLLGDAAAIGDMPVDRHFPEAPDELFVPPDVIEVMVRVQDPRQA
jgi:hypothetical protein